MEFSKQRSPRNLPTELWTEILSRLPVKSLLVCRSVGSVSWRELIDDPGFARLHLRRLRSKESGTHLLLLQGCFIGPYLEVRSAESLQVTANLDFLGSWDVLSSIDGLLMLLKIKQRGSSISAPELMLSNPATRETLVLPPSPRLQGDMFDVVIFDLGLGFDPLSKDYKHVRLSIALLTGVYSVAVYSLATSSWKTTSTSLSDDDDDQWRVISLYKNRTKKPNPPVFCINGTLFCLSPRTVSREAVKLVSFDLRTETFASSELPGDDLGSLTMAENDDGCSLALITLSESIGRVWALEGLGAKSWSWCKRYTFDPDVVGCGRSLTGKFFYITKKGEMLMLMGRSDLVTSYNLQNNEVKTIQREDLQWIRAVVPYTESLTPLKTYDVSGAN